MPPFLDFIIRWCLTVPYTQNVCSLMESHNHGTISLLTSYQNESTSLSWGEVDHNALRRQLAINHRTNVVDYISICTQNVWRENTNDSLYNGMYILDTHFTSPNLQESVLYWNIFLQNNRQGRKTGQHSLQSLWENIPFNRSTCLLLMTWLVKFSIKIPRV